MSDADIELEYEERLKAAARYLDVIVTYRESGEERTVRTFMDTPEGRGTAAKVADSYFDLNAVEKVRVEPMQRHGYPARERPMSREVLDSPEMQGKIHKAARRAGRCCQPRMLRKPSGPRLCHSNTCPDKPGEAIDVKSYAQHREWQG